MTWKPDYLTLEQAKAWLRIPATDTQDDSELSPMISTVSRAIDDHCNRQFGQLAAPAQWSYAPRYDSERGLWVVDIDDVTDVTGLAAELDGVAIDSYDLEPLNAADKGAAYELLVINTDSTAIPTNSATDRVLITVKWGWTAFPDGVDGATRLQLNRHWARRMSPFGVAGSPSEGSEVRLLSKLDPDVAVSLRGLRRARAVG